MIITCITCGKEFKTFPSRIRIGGGKFCSSKCYSAWFSHNIVGKNNKGYTRVDKTCRVCGGKYTIRKSISMKGKGNLCSMRCMGIWRSKNLIGDKSPTWRGGSPNRICFICGKKFKSKNRKIKDVNKMCCSRECSGKHISTQISGENHYNWKGGKIERYCKLCGKIFMAHKCHSDKNNSIFCSRTCSAIYQISHNKKSGTSIEIKMEKELSNRNINFYKQHPIKQARTVPDFFIKPNICIYCDGDYWHNLPDMKTKDARHNYILGFLGYKVLRFWEHEINTDVKKCVDRIKESIWG